MSGARLERKATDSLAATDTIRPLRDYLVVEPLDWSPDTKIHAIRYGSAVRGRVIAAGPGCYRKRYSANRTRVWETRTFIPMEVRVGDVVNWGGLNIFDGKGYSFPSVLIGGKEHLVIQQQDVCGIEAPRGTGTASAL